MRTQDYAELMRLIDESAISDTMKMFSIAKGVSGCNNRSPQVVKIMDEEYENMSID